MLGNIDICKLKPIKIEKNSESEIVDALSAVNGRASAHTYTSFNQILKLSERAEQNLEYCLLPQKYRRGAVFESTSGGKVLNAYRYSRTATRVRIMRKSSDWYLVDVESDRIFKEGGKSKLILTESQSEVAVGYFRKRFHVDKVQSDIKIAPHPVTTNLAT